MVTRRTFVLLAIALTLLLSAFALAKEPTSTASSATALQDYVDKPDASYGWTQRRSGKFAQGDYVELTLTSQTWRGKQWHHQLFIYRPSKVTPAATALLLINGGDWKASLAEPPAEGSDGLPSQALVIAQIAEAMQTPVAIVCQVPEQPLFDGMHEDEIISYTFEEFCKTGDCDWPLLLPMVKSAVRAMDAVEEFTAQEWNIEIDKFLATGASKRGWTTWLTAAIDSRVCALAPLVINMLNMEPHMELQQKSFGGFSDEIKDYTDRGIDKMLKSPRGVELRSIVDPYSYRQQISQPKLIILGTNDRYWPVDSLNLYWDALVGEKYILYVPNNGHGIHDYSRVIGSVVALYRSVRDDKPLPRLDWKFEDGADSTRLELSLDSEPLEVVAWKSASKTRDFRQAQWSSQPIKPSAGKAQRYSIEIPDPADGFEAVFAEVKFAGEPLPFHLSTGLKVIGSANDGAAAGE